MDVKDFKKRTLDCFPTTQPNPSRLFEGVRTESGHEKLEFLAHVEWPELSIELLTDCAGEFWQLSSVWQKYFLPAFMTLTASIELETQCFGQGENQIIEITNDDQITLIHCLFIYWCNLKNIITKNSNLKSNCFDGLTSNQIGLVEIWLRAIDFKTLNLAYELPDGFNFTDEGLNNYISTIRKYSL